MTRWKLKIEYDGTGFCGWQRQAHGVSVQQTVEEAIEKFSGETVALFAAGRTDSGVHAKGQVAHFDLKKDTTLDTVRDAINYYVRPNRVVVLDVAEVSSEFHARFNAKSRTYHYTIINRRAPLALQLNHAWHIHKPLDIKLMRKAARCLIGKHDFSTFRAQHCQAKSPIRTLDLLDIQQDGEVITITTKARSFLYHQVRNMVGTLAMVGTGQWSVESFMDAFAAVDRTKGGPTAPSCGLCFWDVEYW